MIFMALCHAFRRLFRPRGVSDADIQSIYNNLKNFMTNYYEKIYRGSAGGRRSACLPFLLFCTLFRCSARAVQPRSPVSFRWNGNLRR